VAQAQMLLFDCGGIGSVTSGSIAWILITVKLSHCGKNL
jgi:hypothetical protein